MSKRKTKKTASVETAVTETAPVETAPVETATADASLLDANKLPPSSNLYSEDELRLIASAVTAYGQIKRDYTRHRDDWFKVIGPALILVRDKTLKIAETRNVRSQAYRSAIGDELKRVGLDVIDRGDRSYLLKIMHELPEVEAWLATRTNTDRLNHPKIIWTKYLYGWNDEDETQDDEDDGDYFEGYCEEDTFEEAAATTDSAPTDSASNDSAGQESAGNDSAPNDSAGSDDDDQEDDDAAEEETATTAPKRKRRTSNTNGDDQNDDANEDDAEEKIDYDNLPISREDTKAAGDLLNDLTAKHNTTSVAWILGTALATVLLDAHNHELVTEVMLFVRRLLSAKYEESFPDDPRPIPRQENHSPSPRPAMTLMPRLPPTHARPSTRTRRSPVQ
jgi:hypothetical protein